MCTFAEVFRTNCSHSPAASAEVQIQIGSDSEEHISPPRSIADDIKERNGRPLRIWGCLSFWSVQKQQNKKE